MKSCTTSYLHPLRDRVQDGRMWIVLLDHSSSMGQSFLNVPRDPVPELIAADTRLQAAKAVFLAQLRRLPRKMQVVVLAFTTQLKQIASGENARWRRHYAHDPIAMSLMRTVDRVMATRKKPRVQRQKATAAHR
jgi:hypothetical protein